MLLLDNAFEELPILNVQTSSAIGQLETAIIDPRKLHIVAFYCTAFSQPHSEFVLHTDDIRETTSQGVIIDHQENLMILEDDLVRLQQIVDLNFTPLQKMVRTNLGRKLGKVEGYAYDSKSYFIIKLHVKNLLSKNLGVAQSIVDRKQIVEMDDATITIRDTHTKLTSQSLLKKLLVGKLAGYSPRASKQLEEN